MSLSQSALQRVTLKDIAREVGLSFGAVSLALRNSPKIAPATRERVQAAARKLNYHPNALAVGMARFKHDSKIKPVTPVLAWLNGWSKPEELRRFREFDLCWRGAEQAAAKFGYRLEETVVRGGASLRRVEKMLRTREIRGLLLPPHRDGIVDWQRLNLEGFAMISLGRKNESPFAHCVSSAQAANTMLAFDRMTEKGYRRIGYVGPFYRPRLFGAGMGWVQNEVPAARRVPPFFAENQELHSSRQALAAWISKYRPDGIFTENPDLPEVLSEIGISVPGDIGLAAASVLDEPAIDAGIYQNSEEIGRVAVLSVISLLNERDYGIPAVFREILIKGDWVDGSTLPDRSS